MNQRSPRLHCVALPPAQPGNSCCHLALGLYVCVWAFVLSTTQMRSNWSMAGQSRIHCSKGPSQIFNVPSTSVISNRGAGPLSRDFGRLSGHAEHVPSDEQCRATSNAERSAIRYKPADASFNCRIGGTPEASPVLGRFGIIPRRHASCTGSRRQHARTARDVFDENRFNRLGALRGVRIYQPIRPSLPNPTHKQAAVCIIY